MAREHAISEEMDARRQKNKAARERKAERQAAKRNELAGEDEA
jgi:large subunit ribosomal protein L19e